MRRRRRGRRRGKGRSEKKTERGEREAAACTEKKLFIFISLRREWRYNFSLFPLWFGARTPRVPPRGKTLRARSVHARLSSRRVHELERRNVNPVFFVGD